MRTRALMMSSAGFMFVLGVAMSFAPAELLAYCGGGGHGAAVLFVQAAGALYVGFSALNWMAKDNLIGGIYSRPVAMGNFGQFFILGMALLRYVMTARQPWAIGIAAVYALFAGWFGWVAFTTPASVARRAE